MTFYVDASALLKRYLSEPDSDAAERILLSDPEWVSARHTSIEVRRNLARRLRGRPLADAGVRFQADWEALAVVELTAAVCERAARLAEKSGARTLDALHLGAAQEVGSGALPFVTYDRRQAQAARSLGWTVLGA